MRQNLLFAFFSKKDGMNKQPIKMPQKYSFLGSKRAVILTLKSIPFYQKNI